MKRILLFGFLLAASTLPCGAQAQQPPACGSEKNPCWVGVPQSEIPPAPAPRLPEVLTDISWAALATADVDLSHRCIATRLCHEANPILSGSLPRASVIEGAETLGSMWAFHRLRKSHPKLAWLIPGVNIALHGVALYQYEHGR